MDREHLLWITISSYYYFYLIYCLTVDKRLLRTLEREDFYPVYQLLRSYKDRWFYKGVYRGLFYFTLPVYLFLNRLRYYRARTSDGKRLHKHDFLYRYSVYFTFPLLMTRILVYLAQDDTNEVINTVANLYYTLVYRIPYVQLLFSLLVMYFYILIAYYCEKKVCRFYFLSHLLTIVFVFNLYYSNACWVLFLLFRECSRRSEDFLVLLWDSLSNRKAISLGDCQPRKLYSPWFAFDSVWLCRTEEASAFLAGAVFPSLRAKIEECLFCFEISFRFTFSGRDDVYEYASFFPFSLQTAFLL